MKPDTTLNIVAFVAVAVLVGLILDRDVSVTTPAISFAITAPPEIDGVHAKTDTGWVVKGHAVIRATMPDGLIREVVVPRGETRRVRVTDGTDGTRLEVQQ